MVFQRRVALGLMRATGRIVSDKWRFMALAVLIGGGTVYLLAMANMLPVARLSTPIAVETTIGAELPIQVSIPLIGLAASVSNPETTDIATLDALLLTGAVRYPTSAKLGAQGNVVIFGHSSYLPVVGNQAYRSFNEIQKLKAGDPITVYSSHSTYVYSVKSVTKQRAEEGVIPLQVGGRVLTLVTCNSFGKKSDRFVVVAEFVESRANQP